MRIQTCMVLIVDSTPATWRAYHHLLTGDATYQYSILEAVDGAQALALCQQSSPACIVIASHLPDMDGLTLLQRLLQLLGTHAAAFVLVIDQDESVRAQWAMQNGAHDYLYRDTITAELLRHRLHLAIDKAALQREISHHQAWLRAMASNIGEGLIATDPAGSITFMNQLAATLSGWSVTEAIGESLTTVFQVIHAQTRQPLKLLRDRALQAGPVDDLANHALLVTRDGRTIPIDHSVTAVTDAQGKLLGFALTLRQEQPRLNAKAVHDGEARFRQLTDAMPQIVWTTTPAGVVDYFNKQWFTFTGLSLEASLADASVAIHPDDRGMAVAAWQAAQPEGIAYEYEMRLRRYDGIYRWFLARCLPEYNGQGQVSRWYGTSTDITERKLAEEQLRYQAFLLENVQDAVISTDMQFRIVTWNRGAEQLYGWLAIEVIGRMAGELLQTAYLDADPEEVPNTFMRCGRWQGEVTQRNQQGERVTVSNITVLLRDSHGRPMGAVAVNRDITARKAAEAAQQHSEQLLRNIIDNVAAFVGLMTPDGILLEANRTALHAANVTPADVIGKHFADTYWWSYSTQVQAQLRAAIARTAAGEVMRYDATIRLSEAHHIIIDFMLAPIFDQQGRVAYLVPSAVDVTERRHAEAALRMSEERLRLALAGGRMGIWEWHAASNQSIWDEQEYALFGLPVGTEITYPVFESFIYPEDRAQLKSALDTTMMTGGDYSHEFRIIRPDGEIRWLAEYGIGIPDAQNRVTRILGINFDITERKVQEEALHQLTVELEARVAERTAALKATNEKLEVANHELEQFTYAAAHDLKSPLRGIQNLVQFLMEDAAAFLPAKSQKHLSLLQGRAQRLEQLLNGLLDYSRIGREHYAAETVDSAALVEEIVELLAPPAGFSIISTALPILLTHRVPLATTLRNLISNAIKHHHQPAMGQVQVTARLLDQWVEFCVADNGPGIAPEFHERIFAMFQTLQSRDLVEGSGIGLTLVKKIVESYGGQIAVESAVGQGATFRFIWPRVL